MLQHLSGQISVVMGVVTVVRRARAIQYDFGICPDDGNCSQGRWEIVAQLTGCMGRAISAIEEGHMAGDVLIPVILSPFCVADRPLFLRLAFLHLWSTLPSPCSPPPPLEKSWNLCSPAKGICLFSFSLLSHCMCQDTFKHSGIYNEQSLAWGTCIAEALGSYCKAHPLSPFGPMCSLALSKCSHFSSMFSHCYYHLPYLLRIVQGITHE